MGNCRLVKGLREGGGGWGGRGEKIRGFWLRHDEMNLFHHLSIKKELIYTDHIPMNSFP